MSIPIGQTLGETSRCCMRTMLHDLVGRADREIRRWHDSGTGHRMGTDAVIQCYQGTSRDKYSQAN